MSTCKYRQIGTYEPVCGFTGECVHQNCGAYLLTCSDATATEPTFYTEHCAFCGDNAPQNCCKNPQCPAYVMESHSLLK